MAHSPPYHKDINTSSFQPHLSRALEETPSLRSTPHPPLRKAHGFHPQGCLMVSRWLLQLPSFLPHSRSQVLILRPRRVKYADKWREMCYAGVVDAVTVSCPDAPCSPGANPTGAGTAVRKQHHHNIYRNIITRASPEHHHYLHSNNINSNITVSRETISTASSQHPHNNANSIITIPTVTVPTASSQHLQKQRLEHHHYFHSNNINSNITCQQHHHNIHSNSVNSTITTSTVKHQQHHNIRSSGVNSIITTSTETVSRASSLLP
ncbi:hypothetical protein H8959_008931 [Pygathrix nigripes]